MQLLKEITSKKTILVDAINAFVIKWEWIYQPLYDLLETYPNKKIILTGANEEQMKKFGLDNMPYEIFTLKHNPEKTELEYYETMLNKFNLQAQDVVYFEHNKEAMETANTVWITTHFYDKDKKDIEALKDFLDSNM